MIMCLNRVGPGLNGCVFGDTYGMYATGAKCGCRRRGRVGVASGSVLDARTASPGRVGPVNPVFARRA